MKAARTLHLVPPVHRATHRVGLFLAGLGGDGLSQGEAHILALLAESNPATIGELYEGLAHKRSTLTSILDRLADRAFITREPGVEDRRTFVITLTPAGRQAASRVHAALFALEQAVRRRATPAQVAACIAVLTALETTADATGGAPPRRRARRSTTDPGRARRA